MSWMSEQLDAFPSCLVLLSCSFLAQEARLALVAPRETSLSCRAQRALTTTRLPDGRSLRTTELTFTV